MVFDGEKLSRSDNFSEPQSFKKMEEKGIIDFFKKIHLVYKRKGKLTILKNNLNIAKGIGKWKIYGGSGFFYYRGKNW